MLPGSCCNLQHSRCLLSKAAWLPPGGLQAETLSVEEIQQRAAALRQQKSGAADGKEGLLQVGGGARGRSCMPLAHACPWRREASLRAVLRSTSSARPPAGRSACCRRPSHTALSACRPLPSSPQGVTEEIGLIKWPGFGKATLQTLLVIAIVAGTAATLLAINGLLAELSKQLY